ncbi:MAG: hypothetical protein KDA60_08735 [Planctomycetales bacterium]|nr:hypothetical protein [Planctomycetales bacterium]
MMTYYVQNCPTCGRSLQVRLQYLGKRVVCRHCHGEFIATDPESQSASSASDSSILARADELLSSLEGERHLGVPL